MRPGEAVLDASLDDVLENCRSLKVKTPYTDKTMINIVSQQSCRPSQFVKRTMLALASGTVFLGQGAVFYDHFDNPASGQPSASLWIFKGTQQASQADSVLTMIIPTGYWCDLYSTATFGYGVFGFQFSNSLNSSYRGFGLRTAGGDRILLRDDYTEQNKNLRLEVYTSGQWYVDPRTGNNVSYGPNDLWEFDYHPNGVSLYRNSQLVADYITTVTTDPVMFYMFAYSGGGMSFDYVAYTPVPEPSGAGLAAAVILALVGLARTVGGRQGFRGHPLEVPSPIRGSVKTQNFQPDR